MSLYAQRQGRQCISLFSGAGISDVGFERAGFDCLAQVEIDKTANRVRRKHFPNVQHFEDIRSFDAKQFLGVDAVFGGFPCQDYSVAGNRAGLAGDRGALWWELHRVLGECRAPFIGLENVPGLLSSDKGIAFGTILNSLVQLGYCVAWRILNLRYFGVPQRRRRVLIVGHLGGGRASQVQFDASCLSGNLETFNQEGEEDPGDVAGCLGGGSGARGWSTSLDVCGAFIPTHSASLMAKGNDSQDPTMQTYIPIQYAEQLGRENRQNGMGIRLEGAPMYTLETRQPHGVAIPFSVEQITSPDNRSNPQDGDPCHSISAYGHGPAVAFTSKDHGADASEVSPTLRGMGHDKSHANGGGQVAIAQGWRVRRLTPRECERLSGLPDDFTRWDYEGKELADGPRYKLLGNAWCVPQAEWLARGIMRELSA